MFYSYQRHCLIDSCSRIDGYSAILSAQQIHSNLYIRRGYDSARRHKVSQRINQFSIRPGYVSSPVILVSCGVREKKRRALLNNLFVDLDDYIYCFCCFTSPDRTATIKSDRFLIYVQNAYFQAIIFTKKINS